MTAGDLLASLRARGLRLQRVGPALHVAPRAVLTEADRTAIREHLTELKALVEAETATVATVSFVPVASGASAAVAPSEVSGDHAEVEDKQGNGRTSDDDR